MAERSISWTDSAVGRRIARLLGLPMPVPLVRPAGGFVEAPLSGKVVAIGGKGRAAVALRTIVERAGGRIVGAGDEAIDVLLFDGTGLRGVEDLADLHRFFRGRLASLSRNGRVLMIAEADAGDPAGRAIARALEGFCRALGKEIGRRGAVANLLRVEGDALDRLDGPVRFLAGPGSAYVGGQAVTITAHVAAPAAIPTVGTLEGRTALVTGAARGIGAAIAARLAMDGAHVLCLDVPTAAEALSVTAERIGGEAVTLDIAAPGASSMLAERIRRRGAIDALVHNAGITRDRTLARMSAGEWDAVIAVNLSAVLAIDSTLLREGLISDGGRLVYLSSIGGIAGNPGQTAYAATKAALIGYAAALAPTLADRGITANAVAPGFIETAMTARMPFITREVGRRANALAQGGRPEDVAETIAFLTSPGACGISGATIRVCGQALIGA